MRLRLAILAIGTIAAVDASASSFVVVGDDAPSARSSIVTLGPSEAVQAVNPTSLDAIARLDAEQPALSQPEFEPDPIGALIAASETAAPGDVTPVIRTISASVIVMGPVTVMAAAPPPTDDEVVAAIPRRPHIPTVIRGGVIGDVFATAAPAPTVQLPSARSASADCNQRTEPARQQAPDPVPPMPEPPAAPPPPPPPSRPPPMLKGPE